MATMILMNPKGFPGPSTTSRSLLKTPAQKQAYQMRLKSSTQKMSAGQAEQTGTGTRPLPKGMHHPIGLPGAASPRHLVTQTILKDLLKEMTREAAVVVLALPSIALLGVARVAGPCLGPQLGPSQGPASTRSCQEHEG